MLKNILLIFFLSVVSQGISQNFVFDVVEEMPEFPGGAEKMNEFIDKNIKYPEEYSDLDIEGKVYVQFIVSRRGKISDIEIIKSINESFSKEAINVIKKMPKWKPGEQRGKRVNVRYTMPIKFSPS